jgi:hypothetical protein
MSYRRSARVDIGSSRWRTEHYNQLARWLPREVIDSDTALVYVLLHGGDEFGTGWEPGWLTVEAAREFLAFLQAELGDNGAYEIIREVQKRVASVA